MPDDSSEGCEKSKRLEVKPTISLSKASKIDESKDNDEQDYQDHLRDLKKKENTAISFAKIFLISISAFLTICVVITYIWHLILPCWRWLSPEQLINIKDLSISIIAGIGMSFLTAYYFKK